VVAEDKVFFNDLEDVSYLWFKHLASKILCWGWCMKGVVTNVPRVQNVAPNNVDDMGVKI